MASGNSRYYFQQNVYSFLFFNIFLNQRFVSILFKEIFLFFFIKILTPLQRTRATCYTWHLSSIERYKRIEKITRASKVTKRWSRSSFTTERSVYIPTARCNRTVAAPKGSRRAMNVDGLIKAAEFQVLPIMNFQCDAARKLVSVADM